LIEKNKPEWQKGFLNGVGGKIEPDESAEHAMQREFKEETGVDIKEEWILLGQMGGEEFNVFIFKTASELTYRVSTMESEEVGIYEVRKLPELKVINNLNWLIPACLSDTFKRMYVRY